MSRAVLLTFLVIENRLRHATGTGLNTALGVSPKDTSESVVRGPSTGRPATTLPATSQPSSFSEPIWRADQERAAVSLPCFEEDWPEEGGVLMDVSSAVDQAGTWRVGDRLTIDIPQLVDRYPATIDRIDDGPGGYSRSARGSILSDDGQNRRAVVTAGPTRVLAYIVREPAPRFGGCRGGGRAAPGEPPTGRRKRRPHGPFSISPTKRVLTSAAAVE